MTSSTEAMSNIRNSPMAASPSPSPSPSGPSSSSTTTTARRSIFPPSCTSATKRKVRSTSFGSNGDSSNATGSPAGATATAAAGTAAMDAAGVDAAGLRRRRNKIEFSPYARCLKVESHHDMTEEEKAAIWWTKANYSEFARVSRIISKAMLEGGSEIWLQSTSSSSSSASPSPSSKLPSASPASTDDNEIVALTTRTTVAAGDDASASAAAVTAPQLQQQHNTSNVELVKKFHETRDKWWVKFGHSRRGLEHIASIGEGKQRMLNVRSSIKAVMEEQERIRLKKKSEEATSSQQNDDISTSSATTATTTTTTSQDESARIRTVYLQHTQWARTLSRAAGQADADVVRTNFDESKRKSREYYLRVHLNGGNITTSSVGAFDDDDENEHYRDQPINGLSPLMRKVLTIDALKLDKNTVSQLSYRRRNLQRKQEQQQQKPAPPHRPKLWLPSSSRPASKINPSDAKSDQRKKSGDDDAAAASKKSPSIAALPPSFPEGGLDEKKSDSDDETVPSLTSTSTSSSSSSEIESVPLAVSCLAKKAQGYTGTSDEKDMIKSDMSAVLTGQGVAQSVNIVG